MLIKTDIQGVSALVHGGKSYPVVDGIADVPQDVYEHVTSFSHWNVVTDQVDKKVQQSLKNTQDVEVIISDDQKPDGTPQP